MFNTNTMSQPTVNVEGSPLTLIQKLEVLRFISEGHSHEQAASRFNLSSTTVVRIINARSNLEKARTVASRKNLTIEEKIRIIHFLKSGNNTAQAAKKFKVSARTVRRVSHASDDIADMEQSGVPIGVSRPLKARFPEIEHDAMTFVHFILSERLPVTLSLIQERALMSAAAHNIPTFKGSRVWLTRFLRCSGIQPSTRLHGTRWTPGTNQGDSSNRSRVHTGQHLQRR